MFSPDGWPLHDDGPVHLWDVATAQLIEMKENIEINRYYTLFCLHQGYSNCLATFSVFEISHDTCNIKYVSIDGFGFLHYHGKRWLWVPTHLRGDIIIASHGTVVIGGRGGAMTFVKEPKTQV